MALVKSFHNTYNLTRWSKKGKQIRSETGFRESFENGLRTGMIVPSLEYILIPVLRIRIRRIRMFLGLLDPGPDPLVRGTDPDPATDPDPSFIKKKLVRKTLIPTVLWLLFDFLSFKNDVNVPSNSIKQKNFKKKKIAGSESLSNSQRHGSATLFHTLMPSKP
jgi:hypothetical protein